MAETAHSSFWDNLFKPKPSIGERIAAGWAATPLFQGVPKREIRRLAEEMHARSYAPGEVVFRAGDLGVGAALVLSGRVEIRMGDTRITTLGPGDFFGEVALVADQNRTADAIALEPVELVFFLRITLDEWLERKPRIAARTIANLAQVLAERLRHANRQLQAQPSAEAAPVRAAGAGQ